MKKLEKTLGIVVVIMGLLAVIIIFYQVTAQISGNIVMLRMAHH